MFSGILDVPMMFVIVNRYDEGSPGGNLHAAEAWC